MTTTQELAEMAKRAGLKRGTMRLKAEDFRAEAAQRNEEANAELGNGHANLAAEKFASQDYYAGLAAQYDDAAAIM